MWKMDISTWIGLNSPLHCNSNPWLPCTLYHVSLCHCMLGPLHRLAFLVDYSNNDRSSYENNCRSWAFLFTANNLICYCLSYLAAWFCSIWVRLTRITFSDAIICVFRTLDNSLMKILVMLLGEFDLSSTILEDENSFWLTKAIFALFILSMSIVIMNLMVELAVHDIGAQR